MREELHRLPALHKRLREITRNLSARLSRDSNPAEGLRALLASCEQLSDELGGTLAGQREGTAADDSADWKRLREVAERGRNQLAQVKERVKRSSPATRELEALSPLLNDLVAMLPEAGTVLPGAGVAVSEDVRAQLSQVRNAIDQQTWSFVRTTPFASIVREGVTVDFDLKDLLLIGALAHADVLLVGKTGSGKTKLAVKVMEALFGKHGYYSKTTLPSMSPTDFMDIDFRGIKAGTKTLQQAIEGVPALILPGIVLNEANRAPAVVQSMLIPFLDREFEIEGKPVDVGVLHKEERYQYRILTINEKSEGYAVEDFDPALRDRAVFQIPMDVFPQSEYDVQVMLQSLTQTSPHGAVAQTFPSTGACPKCRGVAVKRTGHDDGRWQMRCESCQGEWTEPDRSQFPVVLTLYEYLRGIPVAPIAAGFLVYLSGLSNCVRSRTGYKEGILFDPGTHCHECHHSKHFHNTNVCGNIRAPSARALVNLQRVAQGFALLRAWKSGHDSVSVTLDDLIAAGPFVLRGKLHLSSAWLQTSGPPGKPFQGCEWEAIRVILDWLRKHFEEGFFSAPEYTLLAMRLRGEGLSAEDVERLVRYADDRDNWAVNKVHMERYKARVMQGEHRP